MATITELRDYVLPDLRGIEPELVDHYARQVLRDFFKTTTLWRETLPLNMTIGSTDYTLTPVSGGQVAGVLRVSRSDGTVVGKMNEGERPRPGVALDAGPPDGYFQLYPGVITFRRAPDQGYQLFLEVYKQTVLDPAVVDIPQGVYDEYVEVIAAGVKSRLQALPSKPWTDTTMATVNNTMYTRAKFAARARVRDGGGPSTARVRAPLFAGR